MEDGPRFWGEGLRWFEPVGPSCVSAVGDAEKCFKVLGVDAVVCYIVGLVVGGWTVVGDAIGDVNDVGQDQE